MGVNKTRKRAVIIFLVVLMSFVNFVSADSKLQTIGVTTDEIDLIGGYRIKFSCEFDTSLTSPDRMKARESYEWTTRLSDGVIVIDVFNPLSNQWESREIEINRDTAYLMNTGQKFQIIPGLSVGINLTPSVNLETNGLASISENKITWSSSDNLYDRKSFEITPNRHTEGAYIPVNAQYFLSFNARLILDLTLVQQDITEIPIFELPLSPSFEKSTKVATQSELLVESLTSPSAIFMGGIVLLMLIFAIIIYKGKKKRNSKNVRTQLKQRHSDHEKKMPFPDKKLKYCIYCGTELSENAKFCGNCGKSRD